MTKTHTPEPWTVLNDEGSFTAIYIEPEAGWRREGPIAILKADSDTEREVARANAQFIIRAVNAHAELLAACRAACSFLSEIDPGILAELLDGRDDLPEMLRTAIARAKGQAS